MGSAVSSLKRLIPPTLTLPEEPDWLIVETSLGFQLPLDFKDLVAAYGPGSFDGFLWILQPAHGVGHIDLLRQYEDRLDALRTAKDSGEEIPFVVGRGEEQLVPWAITDNGDVCYWVACQKDDPDSWAVAVNEARGPTWRTFETSATEFLLAVLSGSLSVDVFPDDFPSPSPAFDTFAG